MHPANKNTPTQSQASLTRFFCDKLQSSEAFNALDHLGFTPAIIKAEIATTERIKKSSKMLVKESLQFDKQKDIAAMNGVLTAVGARIESEVRIERIEDIFNRHFEYPEADVRIFRFSDSLDFAALQMSRSPGFIVTAEGAICGALLATENSKLMVAVVLQPSFYNYPLVSNIQFALIFKNR